MKWKIIKTLIAKDLRLFSRDKVFGAMTVIGLVMYIVFYFVMPDKVNESLEIGIYGARVIEEFSKNLEEEGIILRSFNTGDELKQAVADKDLQIGVSVPDDLAFTVLSGKKPGITVYYSSDLPDEMKELFTVLIGEMINEMTGAKLNLENDEIILGPDMGGRQIPYRDRILPVFLFMLLLAETMALANLITSELENRTYQALLVTPMNISGLFTAKGIVGVLLAFSQVILLVIITGNLTWDFLPLVVTILLGSVMVTGMAFFIASISRDLMTVVAWSSLIMIVLGLPAFAIMFPGPVSGWIKVIPTFYLADMFYRILNFNIGFSGNIINILFITGFSFVVFLLGVLSLKRKLI